jgi:hypothetical protein
MGIQIAHDLTQKQRDEEFYCSMRKRVAEGNM